MSNPQGATVLSNVNVAGARAAAYNTQQASQAGVGLTLLARQPHALNLPLQVAHRLLECLWPQVKEACRRSTVDLKSSQLLARFLKPAPTLIPASHPPAPAPAVARTPAPNLPAQPPACWRDGGPPQAPAPSPLVPTAAPWLRDGSSRAKIALVIDQQRSTPNWSGCRCA